MFLLKNENSFLSETFVKELLKRYFYQASFKLAESSFFSNRDILIVQLYKNISHIFVYSLFSTMMIK